MSEKSMGTEWICWVELRLTGHMHWGILRLVGPVERMNNAIIVEQIYESSIAECCTVTRPKKARIDGVNSWA